MARTKWATPIQIEVLNAKKASFTLHQQQKTLNRFWASLYKDWFELYPPGDPDKDDYARANVDVLPTDSADMKVAKAEVAMEERMRMKRAQLYDYCWNHFRGSAGVKKRQPLNLFPKRKIKQSLTHVYSKLFYATRLKSVIDERWSDLLAKHGDVEPKPSRIKYMNEWVNELWDQETPEIRQQVQDHYNATESRADGADGADDAGDPKSGRASARLELRQGFIDRLPITLKAALDEVEMKTGWGALMFTWGPEPARGGEFGSYLYSAGKTASDGLLFPQFFPNFEKELRAKIALFAEKMFPPEIRKTFALPGTVEAGMLPEGDILDGLHVFKSDDDCDDGTFPILSVRTLSDPAPSRKSRSASRAHLPASRSLSKADKDPVCNTKPTASPAESSPDSDSDLEIVGNPIHKSSPLSLPLQTIIPTGPLPRPLTKEQQAVEDEAEARRVAKTSPAFSKYVNEREIQIARNNIILRRLGLVNPIRPLGGANDKPKKPSATKRKIAPTEPTRESSGRHAAKVARNSIKYQSSLSISDLNDNNAAITPKTASVPHQAVAPHKPESDNMDVDGASDRLEADETGSMNGGEAESDASGAASGNFDDGEDASISKTGKVYGNLPMST